MQRDEASAECWTFLMMMMLAMMGIWNVTLAGIWILQNFNIGTRRFRSEPFDDRRKNLCAMHAVMSDDSESFRIHPDTCCKMRLSATCSLWGLVTTMAVLPAAYGDLCFMLYQMAGTLVNPLKDTKALISTI